MNEQFKEIDTKELEFADTVFIRDIESRVFQTIAIKCLSRIQGIALIEGNLIDHFLSREGHERIKGVHVEQDQKNYMVSLKIEVNIDYDISLPEKAEEIQSTITREIYRLTGLHVATVHVVFKGIIPEKLPEMLVPESISDESESKEEVAEYSTSEF